MLRPVDRHVIRADVLGDSASFAFGDSCFANCIEQARLAVIDVAHHGYDRARVTRCLRRMRFAGVFVEQLFLEAAQLNVGAELARDLRRCLGVEG